eukprot:1157703-Pelagomonas_calceolata.AAC.8
MDPALAQLLEEHKRYFSILPDGKGHICSKQAASCFGGSFPVLVSAAAAEAHTGSAIECRGNKFAKLKKRYDAEHSLEKYEPFILQSANFP